MTSRDEETSRTDAEAWVDAYEVAYANPRGVSHQHCPSCGQSALTLLFILDPPGTDHGTSVFWCSHCLRGLAPNRAPVPAHGMVVKRGQETVPNYSLVLEK
jgi:hypothetical protein